MVTHDRYFLDRVCSEIIEIDNQQLYQYKGNYSYYLEKREERIEAKSVEIERANNLYRTELDWMRRMPQARGHKAVSYTHLGNSLRCFLHSSSSSSG